MMTLALAALLGVLSVPVADGTLAADAADTITPGDVIFVANDGQWDDAVRSMARTGPMTTWFTDEGWTFTLERLDEDAVRGVAVRMTFVGARDDVTLDGVARRASRHNYYGPTGSRADVASFGSLRYRGLYDGIDTVVRPNDGRLEYDLCLEPGADLSAVAVRCEGIDAYSIDDDGALVLHTALGTVTSPAPLTWYERPDGTREEVPCAYRRIDDSTFGFDVPERDASLPLVIDPELAWATYLGGTNFDSVHSVTAQESGGTIIVAGYTTITGFPTTPGTYDATHNGSRDVFISQLSEDGRELLFSTYLGGSQSEEPFAVGMMPDGSIVVTGFTGSVNFPTTNDAYETQHQGGGVFLGSDAFVTRLDPVTGELVFSTLLGGAEDDTGTALGFDALGGVFVAGRTASSDFPATPGAFSTTWAGGTPNVGDSFVARLSGDGTSLTWCTYLGGVGDDSLNAMVVNGSGQATVAGWTQSADFPNTPGAYDTTFSGWSDAYVARLSSDGAQLEFSTLVGGDADDNATTLFVDGNGRLIVGGTTLSPDFPTTAGAHDDSWAGGTFNGDGFVACFDADGEELEYGTLLGGVGDDFPTAVVTDPSGAILVSGWTQSSDFDTTPDAFDDTLGGDTDAFVAQIDPDDGLTYATLLGGDSSDKALAMHFDPSGILTLAGLTTSGAFPVTSGSYDESFGGVEGFISDAFVACVHFGAGLAAGGTFLDLGFGLAGTPGVPPRIQWNGTLEPGALGRVNVTDILDSTPGLLVMGYTPAFVDFKGGIMVPFPLEIILLVYSDATGAVSVPYSWPLDAPSGLVMYVQSFFMDPLGPDGMSHSNCVQAMVP